MNSLYKKIALVCLVSLTVNQAQAFQFSDVLDWIKGHQKTSGAVVAGIAAIIALYCACAKIRDDINRFEKELKVDVYVHPESELLRQNQTNPRFKAYNHLQNGLSKQDEEQLGIFPQRHFTSPSTMLYVARKNNAAVGMAFYGNTGRGSVKRIQNVETLFAESYRTTIKNKLINTILRDNDEDVAPGFGEPWLDPLLKEQLKKVDGVARTVKGPHWIIYDRSAARARGAAGLVAHAAQ